MFFRKLFSPLISGDDKSIGTDEHNESAPRPFYAVAHNSNTIDKVKEALAAGANAIEPDVNIYEDNPGELCISHNEGGSDAPSLREFLADLHTIAVNDDKLSLIVFDCKEGAATPEHGFTLFTAIRDLLTFDTGINIIISVGPMEDAGIFDKIKHLAGPREGFVIDEEDDPVAVSAYFQKYKVINQCYGNGISIPLMPATGPNIRPSIERACALRAATGVPKFIYAWTVNDKDLQHEFIQIGVDGIFTDDMQELVQRIREPQYQPTIRMANRMDNPFSPSNSAYSISIHTADHFRAGTDANISFTLTGSRGISQITVDTSFRFRMERDSWNYATLQSSNLGDLISVTVQRDNAGNAPDWFLDKIVVESEKYKVKKTAVFNMNIGSTAAFTNPLG